MFHPDRTGPRTHPKEPAVTNKPRKNRSSRDKQLARDRALREARLRKANPLYYLQPPFKGYQEWFRVPAHAKDFFEHPAIHDDRLDENAKILASTIAKLGPRYNNLLPMAAVYLDLQIADGVINLAVTGNPDKCSSLPLKELAANLSDPTIVERMRAEHPEANLPERFSETTLITDDAAAMSIHELHRNGFLILDDDNIVNLAKPPKKPGGSWYLNGQTAPE